MKKTNTKKENIIKGLGLILDNIGSKEKKISKMKNLVNLWKKEQEKLKKKQEILKKNIKSAEKEIKRLSKLSN